ncbi:MAG TPA: hypothetical protein DCS11_08570 [Syntrophus sp. (in: bacteria)]|nr:hypothetical protein [Syntrophus sp. (in: bacteria)]
MGFLCGLLSTLFGGWSNRLMGSLEAEAAVLYVGGVRKAREAFIALLIAGLFLLLLMIGFLLVHVALFLWLPWSLTARALVLLVLGVVYFGSGLAVVIALTSQRAWMKFTKVDRLLARLRTNR